MTSDVQDFEGLRALGALVAALGTSSYSIDAPDDPAGEWWLDCLIGNRKTNVAWKRGKGYGIYVDEQVAFGSGPDEVHPTVEAAAKRLLELATGSLQEGDGSERAP